MNTKFCPNCGKQIKDDSKFCIYCGSKITYDKSAYNSEKRFDDSYDPFERSDKQYFKQNTENCQNNNSGYREKANTVENNTSTGINLFSLARVFIIIDMILLFWSIVPLIVGYYALKAIDQAADKDSLLSWSIVTLLFCSPVAGILMLCSSNSDLKNYQSRNNR